MAVIKSSQKETLRKVLRTIRPYRVYLIISILLAARAL